MNLALRKGRFMCRLMVHECWKIEDVRVDAEGGHMDPRMQEEKDVLFTSRPVS
jgi:hypothetical protein